MTVKAVFVVRKFCPLPRRCVPSNWLYFIHKNEPQTTVKYDGSHCYHSYKQLGQKATYTHTKVLPVLLLPSISKAVPQFHIA